MKTRCFKVLFALTLAAAMLAATPLSYAAIPCEDKLQMCEVDGLAGTGMKENMVSTYDYYGEPVLKMQEGTYNNTVYWQVRVQGQAGDCWVELDCGTDVTRLSTTLMVDRSLAFEIYYDTYTLSNTANHTNYVYTRWQGVVFAAIAARGEGTINTTRVASIGVSGWGMVT